LKYFSIPRKARITVPNEVASQMGISRQVLHRRGRKNSLSILRKVVASISHLHYGIPVAEIAHYYGVSGSSVSGMLDEVEIYAKRLKVKVKL